MTKKILFAATMLAAANAHAQTDTLHGNYLDEVIVTANKHPQKQSSTGKVVTVITKEQIEKSSGRTVSQLLNEQAGLTINGSLNNLGANQTIYMRGAASGRTLILIDGVPISDASYINNEFDLNLLSLNNIERIEIARGAQSTLYGSDAEAGVINIITINKNATKPVNAKATVAAGNYSTYRGNAQVYGKVKNFTYNTGYAKLHSKGFSSAYDSVGNNNFDHDGYDGDVADASLQYQFTPEFLLRAFGKYSRYKTDLDFDRFIDEKDFTNTNRMLATGGSFLYSKEKMSIAGQYQYTENKRNYFSDSIDNPSPYSTFYTDDYFAKSQYAELYSNIELGKNVSLLQGADYRYSSMNNQYVTPFFVSLFADTSVSQSSGYASVFIRDNSSKLNVELGGRLNVHSRYGSNRTFTFNPSYRINEHWQVFGSIATGFKAPTLYQLYNVFVGNSGLQPERSKAYEFGVHYRMSNVSARLVYFNRAIKDGIDFDYTFHYFNFNRQNVNGGELELSASLFKGFDIKANYSFLQPKETSQNALTLKDTTYTFLPRRPKHTANLTLSYSVLNKLFVSATAKYVSKRFDTPAADFMLNDYFIIGAYAEYHIIQQLKIFADAQNLTNKKFFDIRGYNSIPFIINGGVIFSW